MNYKLSIRWASLLGITLVLLAVVMRLSYKEDIQDFLPLSETDRNRMAVYQDISGMNRLFVIFAGPDDADRTTQAIGKFVEEFEALKTANDQWSIYKPPSTLSASPRRWISSMRMFRSS